MEALTTSSVKSSLHVPTSELGKTRLIKRKPLAFHLDQTPLGASFCRIHTNTSRSKVFTATTPPPPFSSTESIDPPDVGTDSGSQEALQEKSDVGAEKFDWYAQWYPLTPVCDLDKRVPHAMKVLGLDLVVWWDKNEGAWKVFEDACPHRLAPLSQGRIDQWGRLQCVYHGWCFNGSGNCKFIPQAPRDGPPVHTSKRACVAVYPSTVHQGIVWFWPNTDPQCKDVILEKRPPSVPELDDPSFTAMMIVRDIPYGYEVLIENLMDPSHLPYAHFGITPEEFFARFTVQEMGQPQGKTDRERGKPIDMRVVRLDKEGFLAKQEWGYGKFLAPCLFYSRSSGGESSIEASKQSMVQQEAALIIFYCVPVSPGNSRLISVFSRNYATWIDKIVPRWIFHLGPNITLDSDLCLLHLEERKIKDIGPANWQKACFVPTKSDALVIGYRKWLNIHAGGEVDWRGKYTGELPPTPPREQLLDRYWSHTVICSSCYSAYKGLNALELILQVISIISIGIAATTKQGFMSATSRTSMVTVAIVCFIASKWLAHFIYKSFHFHDYNHALL